MTNRNKFLGAVMAASLWSAPALAQMYPSGTAHPGEIKPQDVERYQEGMRAAMVLPERTSREKAVARARQQLARDAGKPLAARTIAELDGLLDLGGGEISPQLGTSG